MQLKIQNQQLVVTSAINFERFKKAVKLTPSALTVKDDKGNMLYVIKYQDGEGDITPFSIKFNAVIGGNLAYVKPVPHCEAEADYVNHVEEVFGLFLSDFVKYEPIIINQLEAELANISEAIDGLEVL
jgi:hypothetical protein